MRPLFLRFVLALATLTLVPGTVPAQIPGLPRLDATPAPAAGTPEPAALDSPHPEPEAPDSPRAAMRAFLELAHRNGDYAAAARYLELPREQEPRGPELARRLAAVLESHLDLDPESLAADSSGNAKDGLPEGVDSIGHVPDGRGGQDSVYLVRTRDADGAYWAFSRQTTARVDGWYHSLHDRWVRDTLPQALQRHGPWQVMWWQWLALPLLGIVALAIGNTLALVTRRALHRAFRRTRTPWDERLLGHVAPALALLFTVAAAALLLPALALRPRADAVVRSVLEALGALGVFWMLWRAVDVWADFLNRRAWAVDNPSARSLLAVLRTVARVFVAVTGLVTTLAALGYPVTHVLAGLGIGGIAIAFGAQKTIENLFGSLALAADQPFRVGDFVRIEDFVGNVESIGMRSTQIRTLDRTLVSLPNGKLADMRIEDFAARDRIRFTCTVGLVYGTTRAQIERVVSDMERVLREQPLIWPDTVVVRFAGFGVSSLEIEVLAWYQTGDFNVFRDCRQQALFGFMRVVEEAGTSFAFPTQTVHVVPAAPPSGTRGAAAPGE